MFTQPEIIAKGAGCNIFMQKQMKLGYFIFPIFVVFKVGELKHFRKKI